MNRKEAHILVDAHVHIHENFDLNRLFLISIQNFKKTLQSFQIFEPFYSFLLLTESAGVKQFDRLKSLVDDGETDAYDFSVTPTGEPGTLKVVTGGGQSLYVVSGKQIVTSEKLEVLALGLNEDYPDGRPLNYVLEDLAGSSCLRVIPWGAGKWLGSRGQVIETLVASWSGEKIFLGDNGNRPSFWSLPSIFNTAAEKGIYNLPGSDPLPFKELEKKAGSSGFMIRGELDEASPFNSLKSLVTGASQAPNCFGSPEGLTSFFKNQISMQIVKRRR